MTMTVVYRLVEWVCWKFSDMEHVNLFCVEAKTTPLLDVVERAAGQHTPVELLRYLVMHHCILCPFRHT
jgi:hypothetical protein